MGQSHKATNIKIKKLPGMLVTQGNRGRLIINGLRQIKHPLGAMVLPTAGTTFPYGRQGAALYAYSFNRCHYRPRFTTGNESKLPKPSAVLLVPGEWAPPERLHP